MNRRSQQLIISTSLVFFVVIACSLSPASSSTGSTASTASATNQPISTAAATKQPISTAAATNPPVSGSVNAGCANDYFPTTSGTSWSYTSSGGTLGTYTYTWTVTDVNATGFSIAGKYSNGTDTLIKWECKAGGLAALDAGSNSLNFSNSTYKMTSSSITAEGFNVPISFAQGNAWTEDVTAAGTVVSGAQSVNSQIVSNLACTAGGPGQYSMPSGPTFTTVTVLCTQNIGVSFLMQGTAVPAGAPSNVSITDSYAKGVGLVESVRTSAAGGTETIVLTQYKVQ